MSARLQQAVERTLLRAWSNKGALSAALVPVSWLYAALAGLQRSLYRNGWRARRRVPAVVIVVGNVVAGGAGKTPTTIAIVHHLRAQGLAVGVVSRGYGRSSNHTLEVDPTTDATHSGDEPLLIHQSTGVPVVVGRDRAAAATLLLERHPDIRIVVCDDGLQHYRLERDIEVCVFDDRGCGNGRLLPAGPLREPWPRRSVHPELTARCAALVLHTGHHPAFAGFTAKRELHAVARLQDGTTLSLDHLAQLPPSIALAGIAQPDAFFAMLRDRGITLQETIALPDHYHFDSVPASIHGGQLLICTEKDATKLWRLLPQAYAVGLTLTPELAFWRTFDARVQAALAARLSSPHGHPTS